MLRDLIERYLDNLKTERDFDATFMSLLTAGGFFDVHFTHGALEFGKDFIGKKIDASETRQWVFQNKLGDIGTPEMREVKGQLLDAATSSLGHPGLDNDLPRTVVLCFPGRFKGNAGTDFADLQKYVESNLPNRRLTFWNRETLIEAMLAHGPESLFRSSVDVASYGSFYRLYGDILEGKIQTHDIRKHFDRRLASEVDATQKLAATAIEAQLIADAARQVEQPYWALQATLAIVRAVLFEMQVAGEAVIRSVLRAFLNASYSSVVSAAKSVSGRYLDVRNEAGSLWEGADGFALFVSYPVLCCQLLDALVAEIALSNVDTASARAALRSVIKSEPGTHHPISDVYAVSIVAAYRYLLSEDATEAADYLKSAALWLIDRYWDQGGGLAACYASEVEEVRTLLGAPFSGIEPYNDKTSLLATALMDSACFGQDETVYNGLRRDILSADIVPRYYQVQDTQGQFEYDAQDVIRMPNVEFEELMPTFDSFKHGAHLHGEPQSFRLQEFVGEEAYVAVSLLMRDRYFPTTWGSTHVHE